MVDEVYRWGAQRMLAVAVEAETDRYVVAFAAELDGHGHRPVTMIPVSDLACRRRRRRRSSSAEYLQQP